ncbi:RDD family protein [Marinisporobacter balticus]|uniref:Putative RDD family membrane protein YckC n=1 Tax=Marinisporobacter balticus TaxID=2018667 RepID=A0A4R2KMD6_9FIRM|nr:RDD family protein [Marinisporobacter balticus]TCO74594.1 putative RDD family membrane protein YckC [Marinisporobacter balticus]
MQFVSITTPENIEVKYRLAGVASRVVAAFIDYLIQGSVYLMVLFALAGMNDPVKYLESKNSYFLAILLLIIASVNYGYFIVSEMVMNGKTFGKKTLGLRTIRKNGQPMDIKHSLIRNLFRIFVDNYLVGILMIFFRNDDARLGDVLASTMVIEEEKESLYRYFDHLSEDTINKLTEDEKQLLFTYINEKDTVQIDQEILQQKLIDYFTNKYPDTDEEILRIIGS